MHHAMAFVWVFCIGKVLTLLQCTATVLLNGDTNMGFRMLVYVEGQQFVFMRFHKELFLAHLFF